MGYATEHAVCAFGLWNLASDQDASMFATVAGIIRHVGEYTVHKSLW